MDRLLCAPKKQQDAMCGRYYRRCHELHRNRATLFQAKRAIRTNIARYCERIQEIITFISVTFLRKGDNAVEIAKLDRIDASGKQLGWKLYVWVF